VENPNQLQAGPAKSRVPVVRIIVIAAIGVALAVLVYYSPAYFAKKEQQTDHPRLQLGGTSTIFVIVENRWKGKYRDEKGVEIAYDSTGSNTGVTRMIDGTYTIAFTHGPLSPEQIQKARQKGGDVVQIPVLLCGVAPVYNIKELKGKAPLKLTAELLANIFLGNIKEWSHPAIKEVNPDVELPDTKITVVHREDASGTTQIFAEYLDVASPTWRAWREKASGNASEIKWPAGVGAARNLGVATLVDKTDGAIGYVDRMFTSYDDMVLDYAAVQNKDKTAFVRAEPENMTAAAASSLADIPDDLSFSLANKSGKDAYPISALIYAVCYKNQPEASRQRIVDFLRWTTHEGQPHAAKMSYAPLPAELVKRTDQRLETIQATK
jgi:phosphate transport system substrate-binding protein